MHTLRSTTIACVLFGAVTANTHAQTTLIDFETYANGSPVPRILNTRETVPLAYEYESLGVIFSGDAGGVAGTIFSDEAFFEFRAHSGTHLYVTPAGQYISGFRVEAGPVLIFVDPVSAVSLYAPPDSAVNFYDENFQLLHHINTPYIPARPNLGLAEFDAGANIIKFVRPPGYFDDLSFTIQADPVPLPGGALLLASGLAAFGLTRNRRQF